MHAGIYTQKCPVMFNYYILYIVVFLCVLKCFMISQVLGSIFHCATLPNNGARLHRQAAGFK